MKTEIIAYRNLRFEDGVQSRAAIDERIVGEYHQAMVDGDDFPPLVVFREAFGGPNWVADGFHRGAALGRFEDDMRDVLCEVREGGVREAMLYSASANAHHGLRRSNEDKRRSVLMLLDDDEWSGWSDRQIAAAARVSHTYVANLRREIAPVPATGVDCYGNEVLVGDVVRYESPGSQGAPLRGELRARIVKIEPEGFLELRVWNPELGTETEVGYTAVAHCERIASLAAYPDWTGNVATGPVFDQDEDEEQVCRVCGCTEHECEECIRASGRGCFWVEDDLCSRCRDDELLKKRLGPEGWQKMSALSEVLKWSVRQMLLARGEQDFISLQDALTRIRKHCPDELQEEVDQVLAELGGAAGDDERQWTGPALMSGARPNRSGVFPMDAEGVEVLEFRSGKVWAVLRVAELNTGSWISSYAWWVKSCEEGASIPLMATEQYGSSQEARNAVGRMALGRFKNMLLQTAKSKQDPDLKRVIDELRSACGVHVMTDSPDRAEDDADAGPTAPELPEWQRQLDILNGGFANLCASFDGDRIPGARARTPDEAKGAISGYLKYWNDRAGEGHKVIVKALEMLSSVIEGPEGAETDSKTDTDVEPAAAAHSDLLSKADWRNVQKLQEVLGDDILLHDLDGKNIYRLIVDMDGTCMTNPLGPFKTKAETERQFKSHLAGGAVDIKRLDTLHGDEFVRFRRREPTGSGPGACWSIWSVGDEKGRGWHIHQHNGEPCKYDCQTALNQAWMDIVIGNDSALED